jgi:hypothetical protein
MLLITLGLQAATSFDKELFVGDPAVEALAGKNTELGLRQVESAAMLGGVMPFETLDETTRFLHREVS